MLDEGTRYDDRDILLGGGCWLQACTGPLLQIGCCAGPVHECFSTLTNDCRTLFASAEQLGCGGSFQLVSIGRVRHEKTGGEKRLAEPDLDVAVLLLVVDDDVHVVEVLAVRVDLGRRHDVELADLSEALEHLDRLLLI